MSYLYVKSIYLTNQLITEKAKPLETVVAILTVISFLLNYNSNNLNLFKKALSAYRSSHPEVLLRKVVLKS